MLDFVMKRKLTSRKLWLAIIGFVTALLVAFGVDDIKIEQICALIGALGSLCAYILAEGYADARGAKNSDDDKPESEKDENKL
ncbi:MAG: hypothetical protein J6A54_04140 [Clostridia bacterium]|nr:hypothetical protein [Clostridia bacterium]